MPTQSYRFYDPGYQAALQSTIHNSNYSRLSSRHPIETTEANSRIRRHHHEQSEQYERTSADANSHDHEHGQTWARSAERTDFENAARTGCDMSHIISHRSWVQYDWSNKTPVYPTQPSAVEPYTRQVNIYVLDGNSGNWSHRAAGTLALHQSPSSVSGARRQPWVTLHSYGSGRLEGSFSLFPGIEIIRFNDSVLCTTIQTIQTQNQNDNGNSSVSNTQFVTYSFQTGSIDQASELRQQLAMAARPPESASGNAVVIPKPRVDIDGGMEKRLTSWINALEARHAPLMQMQQSSLSFDGEWNYSAYNIPEQSNSMTDYNGFNGFNGPNGLTAPGVANAPQPRGLRRRGGVDLGNAYWDLEKSRALEEAKSELDSLHLKRLFSGFELAA